MTEIRTVLVDDHAIVLEGLRFWLAFLQNIRVQKTFTDPIEFLKRFHELRPSLVVTDFDMPGLNGAQLTGWIKRSYPKTKVLVFTEFNEPYVLRQITTAGADAFVCKSESSDVLRAALQALLAGEKWLPTNVSVGMQHQSLCGAHLAKALTPTELQVLRYICEDLTAAEIADRMHVSPHTTNSHRSSLKRKMKCQTVAGLVSVAFRYGLVES